MAKRKTANLYKTRGIFATVVLVLTLICFLFLNPNSYKTEELIDSQESPESSATNPVSNASPEETNQEPLGETSQKSYLATELLEKLQVKGRAAKTGYSRTEFYNGWPKIDGCSLRQKIIKREFGDSATISTEDNCTVISGEFDEPYTGEHKIFYEKSEITNGIQIDHVVALSDAWQKGAQNLSKEERYDLATDPLNLLAVDAKTNQGKSDGDAATWLPSNKKFRCAYIARQISVKYKYSLWVTKAEKDSMQTVLKTCPNEAAVGV